MTDRDGKAVPGVSPRRARRSLLAGLALTLGTTLPTAKPLADEAAGSFDPQTLAQRGIDPQLANLLLEAPRFAAGRHALNLNVNGQRRGRVDVVFNHQGALCFNPL